MRTQPRFAGMVLPLLGILLVAINLRPAITSVGPVLPLLGDDLSLDGAALGLLGALPLAVFGAVSALVQPLVARFGVERTTAGALALLTVATLLRSWPGPNANLWVGTVLVGAGIAVGNVTVPVIVKRSFPRATALVTSVYVAVLGIFAGLAAALAVPIAAASDLSWRLSLGVWAVLTLTGMVFWAGKAVRARGVATERPGTSDAKTDAADRSTASRPPSVWRQATAWQISVYMGVQSSVFYVSLTWLPTVEQQLGISAVAAGWHMFLLQVAGVVGNLAAPTLMRIGGDQRFAAILPGALFLIALAGMFLAPAFMVAWVGVLGLGTGSAFVVALSLIVVRAGDLASAGRLSAMAQSIGYAITSAYLLVAGLAQSSGPSAVFIVLATGAVLVATMGALAGRNRLIGHKPTLS